MPSGMQKVDGQFPGLPARCSAKLWSNIFWYSGVSGGGPESRSQLLGGPPPARFAMRICERDILSQSAQVIKLWRRRQPRYGHDLRCANSLNNVAIRATVRLPNIQETHAR